MKTITEAILSRNKIQTQELENIFLDKYITHPKYKYQIQDGFFNIEGDGVVLNFDKYNGDKSLVDTLDIKSLIQNIQPSTITFTGSLSLLDNGVDFTGITLINKTKYPILVYGASNPPVKIQGYIQILTDKPYRISKYRGTQTNIEYTIEGYLWNIYATVWDFDFKSDPLTIIKDIVDQAYLPKKKLFYFYTGKHYIYLITDIKTPKELTNYWISNSYGRIKSGDFMELSTNKGVWYKIEND